MNEKNEKEDSLVYWVNLGADVTGGVSTAIVSIVDPTVTGALVGTSIGTLASNAIKAVFEDMRERALSKMQQLRTSSACVHIMERFDELLKQGKTVREDDFFKALNGNCSNGSELLEGVLMVAQDSFDEKILKHFSYFYANFVFETHRDRFHANHFLAIAKDLTYRQLCLLAIYNEKKKFGIDKKIDPLNMSMKVVRHDLIADLYLLGEKKLFFIVQPPHTFQFPSENASITDHGKEVHRLFSLDKIPNSDILEVAKQFITDVDLSFLEK